jgi:hypothetical protein
MRHPCRVGPFTDHRRQALKKLMLGAALALAVVAAGCGGGGGGDQLTKEAYAAQLNTICNEANETFSQLSGGTMAEFKEKGDDVVDAAEKAAGEFHDVQGPDELVSASGTFNDSADEIVEDLEKMNEAAQNDNQEEFDAAAESLQHHGAENDEAATEIGATDCAGS